MQARARHQYQYREQETTKRTKEKHKTSANNLLVGLNGLCKDSFLLFSFCFVCLFVQPVLNSCLLCFSPPRRRRRCCTALRCATSI